MLEEQFAEFLPYLAAGLFGSGSDCFGFDDDISQDHDFEPGFCIFLPGEDIISRRQEFLLERAYSRLPLEYHGFRRQKMLPVGGARHGIFRISEYFRKTVGSEDGNLSIEQWLAIPEEALAEATNGRVFFDNLGEVNRIRESISFYPEDIRLKRLAGCLLLMAQSGQYNYLRCIRHGEPPAAQMAIFEFVKSTLSVIFLLNRIYQPYYKWVFRAMRDLPLLSETEESLYTLMANGNGQDLVSLKTNQIEDISRAIIAVLREQKLTRAPDNELERHAYSVNDRIKDATLRNMHILAAV